jgi:hypothetical protein
MRIILPIFLFLLITQSSHAQPGTYASTTRKIIGRPFKQNNPDKLFNTYQYIGGYLLDNSTQEFEVWVRQYKKGHTNLIVLYLLDTVRHKNSVLDILELKIPDAVTNIQAGSCNLGGEFSIEIIAIERNGKILNAWRALRDKLRFHKMSKSSLATINCTVEGI